MSSKVIHTDPHKRLYALDALRGFDMFWITGGGTLAVLISKMTGADWLGNSMEHASWEGFHFYDLIFPLFMFIAGVAIPYSISSKLEKNIPVRKIVRKVVIRAIVLILLGILYNGTFRSGLSEGRIASVLGQIGIAYLIASLITIFTRSVRWRLAWLLFLLGGIAIIQLFIPVPGYGSGNLTPEGCINGFIDRLLLPGKLYRETFDPEGLLCNISAAGITLMGTFAGTILRMKKGSDWQKIGYLTSAGTGLIILALLISPVYPIIKSCWTTTFNLLAGGISFILLALFFLITDHWKIRMWAFYFRIIGMNSIFVYLFTRLVEVRRVTEFFFGWLAIPLSEQNGQLLLNIGFLGITWLLLYYMYRKNIFLRV